MKKISSELKKVTKAVRLRLTPDIKRAKSFKGCKKIASKSSHGPISDWMVAINAKIDNEILKSVLVCQNGCLTVSFAEQVDAIRKLLTQASKATQAYSKKVVKCSGVVRKGSGSPSGNNPKAAIDKAFKDSHKLVDKCTVCKQ